MKRPNTEKQNGTIRVTLTFDGREAKALNEQAKALKLDEGDYVLAAYAHACATATDENGIAGFVDEHRDRITDYDD